MGATPLHLEGGRRLMRDGARGRRVATAIRGAVATSAVLLAFAVTATNAAAAPFGLASLSSSSSSSQAGSHPDISTSLALSTDALGNPIGQLKNVAVTLPAGMVGNPQAAERCAQSTFQDLACPAGSQVGVMELSLIVCQGASESLTEPAEVGATVIDVPDAAKFCPYESGDSITIGTGAAAETVTVQGVFSNTQLTLSAPLQHPHAVGETVTHRAELVTVPIPLVDLAPMPGHAATFGASLIFISIFVQADVEADGQLRVTIDNISRLIAVQATKLTLWGVPAASSHDSQRCNQHQECGLAGASQRPFTTYPASCGGSALETQVGVESWAGENAFNTTTLPSPTECEKLTIAPALSVQPDTAQRDTPAGYDIDVAVPQKSEPHDLATPPLRRVAVTLPEGTSLAPGLGVGLQACSDKLFAQDACPDASKIGTVEIQTPLLAAPLTGAVYVGSPTASEKYRLFLDASTAVLDMHIVGDAQPDVATGRVTTSFEDLPQLPFSELKLHLFGGANAVLANPTNCGPATSTAQFISYSGQTSESSSTFTVLDYGEGGGCPPGAAFSPGFLAGTLSPVAGSSSPFVLRITRADGQPEISGFNATLPPGLVGMVAAVKPCPEPQAASGACTAGSQVGTAMIAAGAGSRPLYVSGPIYLTGPYEGAPFGLAAVVDAAAGPFDLGTVIVRSRITIDPSDLAITVHTSSLPQSIGGVSLRLRMLDVELNRPGFMVNPTTCEPQAITARVDSTEGTSAVASEHFQVTGCNQLQFTPRLKTTMPARASRIGHGAGIEISITQPPSSEAALKSVVIELPRGLRPRLTTIEHACPASTATNLAKCPAASIVGRANVETPILSTSLSGLVYLVAHGGTARPSLVLLLEGEGIDLRLEGELRISRTGSIKTVFADLPEVPMNSFDIALPSGPDSILGAVSNPCQRPFMLPYELVDNDGATIQRKAHIAVIGCPRGVKRKEHRK